MFYTSFFTLPPLYYALPVKVGRRNEEVELTLRDALLMNKTYLKFATNDKYSFLVDLSAQNIF
jgi:hypothetical protein